MRNHIIKLSIVLALAAPIVSAQAVDLSTDKAVLAELQKVVDAKRDSSIGKRPDKLQSKDICIQRVRESAKLIVIGFFADDRGCELSGAFVNSGYFEKDDPNFSQNALAALGWKIATAQQRENLAGIWVEKGLLAFSPQQYQRFKSPPNSRDASLTRGEIKVIMMLPSVPGRTTRGYGRKVFVFNSDGVLMSVGI
jgi:hypothetical protein